MVFIKIIDGNVILAGQVANEAMIEEGYFGYEGTIPSHDPIKEKLIYQNGILSVEALPIKVPQTITKVQAMEAMMQTDVDTVHGTSMWTRFKSVLAQNEQANDRWLLAQILDRSDPFVATLAPALNKNSAQIDELFVLAGTL